MASVRALRLIALFTAVVLLGTAVLAPAQSARADAGAPRWTSGDFWLYTDPTDQNSTLRVDVVGREQATTLLGGSYDTFHLRQAISAGSFSITQDLWVRESDLGVVRTSFTAFNTLTITTYDPPQTQANFPLSLNKAWSVTVEGAIKLGNFNPTRFNTTIAASVDAELDVAVPAGTFHSFSIRPAGGGAYTKLYYSDQVGYWSKQEQYNGGGTKTGEMVLSQYKYQWNTTFLAIIGAVIALIAVLVVAYLYRKRKKAVGLPGGPAAPPP
ncbi:MAG TPA: FeoB-associated Cys-rich membrane protein [Thermoplasmata archaeon]|nr:FeoB-associated Cys-rich membrane protein [Thermoplasmata archaeon]